MRRPQLPGRRKRRFRPLDRQPVQEIILAVVVADIEQGSALDLQFQSVIKAEEMKAISGRLKGAEDAEVYVL